MSDISNFVQRGVDHVRIGPMFHLFHTGPARNRPLFAMPQHFTELEDTPSWHFQVQKGAEITSLREGMPFALSPTGFRCLL